MIGVLPFPDIDPALFTLEIGAMQIALRWYALAYIAGLLIGWRLMVLLMRRPRLWPADRAPMTPAEPEELLTWAVLGVVLGGRLGFVLFYNPGHFLAHPGEILRVWEGGMSFHGGFLGVVLAVAGYCRAKGLPLLQIGDAVALATPVGLLLGRLANFVNGELWGRPTDVPWAMIFPSADDAPRHPSQLYQAALEGAVLLALIWWVAIRMGGLKRPGTIIGLFFLGYGAARTFVENFRQGDVQFVTPDNPNGQFWRFGEGPDAFGLTMGQILSLPMVAIGLLFLLNAGWRARREHRAG